MAAENIIFNRRATLAWQSSSPGSRQAQPVQIDPSIALRLRLEASPGGRPAPGRARARRRATPLQVLHDIGVPRRTVREPPQALGTCGPERPAGKDAASDRPRPAACGRRARHGHHDGISLVRAAAVTAVRRVLFPSTCCVCCAVVRPSVPGFSWLPRLPHKYTTAVVDPSTTYLRYRRYYGTLGGTH